MILGMKNITFNFKNGKNNARKPLNIYYTSYLYQMICIVHMYKIPCLLPLLLK